MTEEMINQLLDSLLFVMNKETRKLILASFVKKYGEVPDAYKETIEAVLEM